MTAGRGIVHSEMPEQEDGLLMGFQLWVNLPASAKMSAPGYQEFPPARVPLEQRDNGTVIRVIAGTTGEGTRGPVENRYVDPIYMDVTLPAGQHFEQAVGDASNAFIFVIEGGLLVGDSLATLGQRTLGILGKGDRVAVSATDEKTRFLLVAGQPLNEPIARGGPFVMNTREEVLQAFEDYQNGRF
jgi:redox-sensitive bicupin YhaK (pirin superfamily)